MALLNLHPAQLDLFNDVGVVVYANDALDALRKRDVINAERCIRRITSEEPTYRSLGALQTLCRMIRDWPFAASTPKEVAAAIQSIESELQPAAETLMRGEVADFIRPFWVELTEASGSQVYDPAFPQAFCAGLHLRCGEHLAAIKSVESIPNWDGIPTMLYWHCLARCHIGGLKECHSTLIKLALLAPSLLPAAIAEMGDPNLRKAWVAFKSEFDWLEPEDETAGAWFPVWHLLEHSDSPFAADAMPRASSPPIQALGLLVRILKLEKRGLSPALLALRGKLQKLDENIFALYMKRRSKTSRL